jgi:hypothetical protein
MKLIQNQTDDVEIEVTDDPQQEPEDPQQGDVPCWGCGCVPGLAGCACDDFGWKDDG